MTRRTIKKIAKRYYYGGNVSKYVKSIDDLPENEFVTKTVIRFRSERIENAILDLARRHGWDGNHWDNPRGVCVNYYD